MGKITHGKYCRRLPEEEWEQIVLKLKEFGKFFATERKFARAVGLNHVTLLTLLNGKLPSYHVQENMKSWVIHMTKALEENNDETEE